MPLSMEEIFLHLKACVDQCDHFRKNGKYYRRKHLYRRLETAKEKEDEEAERQILAIIQQEKDKSFWRRLNYALGKPRGGVCFKVQVEHAEGTVEEISGKEDLHEAIWENIHRKRFYLAKEAPMFSGPLRGIVGYNSVTPTAKTILEGTYQYPPDFDEATKDTHSSPQNLRHYHNHSRGLDQSLASGPGRDILINLWSTFWTLQGRTAIAICVLPPSPPIKPGR